MMPCPECSSQVVIDELREDLAAERAKVAELAERIGQMSDHPKTCPVTGRRFFMTMEHPDLGAVATYGGPFDSYTIPEWSKEDFEFRSERYDHDRGEWIEGGEPEILTDEIRREVARECAEIVNDLKWLTMPGEDSMLNAVIDAIRAKFGVTE